MVSAPSCGGWLRTILIVRPVNGETIQRQHCVSKACVIHPKTDLDRKKGVPEA